MNVMDELKSVIDFKIVIKEKELSDKIFDLAVDPLMLKLVDIIPTEFDDMMYASKKQELKDLFLTAITEGVNQLEDLSGMDLDGKEE